MSEKTLLSTLDIGTSKICAVIGAYDSSRSEYHVHGIGRVPSAGMKNGVVVDIDALSRSIEKAVNEALNKSGCEKINGVIIGIAGDHIRSHEQEHSIPIISPDGNKKIDTIHERDLARIQDSIKNITLGIDREIIHVIAQEYIIDEQMIVKNPVGMSGNKLTLKAIIITAAINNARDLVNCVQKTGLSVYDIVLEPIASAESVLTYDQKDLGVCLIDIGGGTTDTTVFRNGNLVSTNIIGLGGEIITRDIAALVQTSFAEAERIKKQYGWASAQQARAEGVRKFYVKHINGNMDLEMNTLALSEYIEARLREIFSMAQKHIITQRHLNAGIVLTGGGALLNGIEDLAKEMFGMNCQIGYPRHLNGLERENFTPDYATAIGLLYSANKPYLRPRFPSGQSKSKLWNKIRERFSEFF